MPVSCFFGDFWCKGSLSVRSHRFCDDFDRQTKPYYIHITSIFELRPSTQVNCANRAQVIDLYGSSSLSAFSVDNFVDILAARHVTLG
jgi:hypothetical protein